MENKGISLAELLNNVKEVIQRDFNKKEYWIFAETANVTFYEKSKSFFLTLVEKNEEEIVAQTSAAVWITSLFKIKKFEAETGQPFTKDIKILVKVKVDFSERTGIRLIILDIDSSYTVGNIELQRQINLKKLLTDFPDLVQKVGDRIITANQKIEIPPIIKNIAVISSTNSAGLEDFLHTLQSNVESYTFGITLFQTQLQGSGAEKQLTKALSRVLYSSVPFDVVVIVRGGGSSTDLISFDNFDIAWRVAGLPIPVITGIGHQKDGTLTDIVANLYLKTPTKVAEFIISHNRNFEEMVSYQWSTIKNTIIREIEKEQHNLENSHKNIWSNMTYQLRLEETKLARFHLMLDMLNPRKMMKKGFAIAMQNNAIIDSLAKLDPSKEFVLHWHDGKVTASVAE